MIEYVGLLILALMAGIVGLIMLMANRVLGPSKPNPVKSQPFECGVEPIAQPAGRMPVHFYILAMLFVVFDVEVVFLFPWAVVLKELGWFGLAEMALFLGIVVAGFGYAWKKGALEWE
jgi:NADH-quinone oxidoreductase subunit A